MYGLKWPVGTPSGRVPQVVAPQPGQLRRCSRYSSTIGSILGQVGDLMDQGARGHRRAGRWPQRRQEVGLGSRWKSGASPGGPGGVERLGDVRVARRASARSVVRAACASGRWDPTRGAWIMTHEILAVGEVLWDLLPAGKQLGGAPANFSYHCRSLGADARLVRGSAMMAWAARSWTVPAPGAPDRSVQVDPTPRRAPSTSTWAPTASRDSPSARTWPGIGSRPTRPRSPWRAGGRDLLRQPCPAVRDVAAGDPFPGRGGPPGGLRSST